MSVSNGSRKLPGSQNKPDYLTAHHAALLSGVAPHTVRAHVEPDAHYVSAKSGKRYALYLPEKIAQWAATYTDRRFKRTGAEL